MLVSMETAHFLSWICVTGLMVPRFSVRSVQHKMEPPSSHILMITRLWLFLPINMSASSVHLFLLPFHSLRLIPSSTHII